MSKKNRIIFVNIMWNELEILKKEYLEAGTVRGH